MRRLCQRYKLEALFLRRFARSGTILHGCS